MNRLKPDWPGVAFPGGKVEPGESFTEALIREVREETGLTIFAPQLCGVKDWTEDGQRHLVFLYQASQFQGNLSSSEEGEVWWEDLENLPNLNLSLDMLDMIKVIEDQNLSEFFYRQTETGWEKELK